MELSTQSEESNSEIKVKGISKKRHNKEKKQDEWLVHWSDGDTTWEEKENLTDLDGTMNVEWLKFQVFSEIV